MAKAKAATQRVAKPEAKFPKQQILQAIEFLGDRDVLNALLPADFVGSKSEVREIISNYNRKVVG